VTALADVSKKLSVSSRRHFIDPSEAIDWPDAISGSEWCMSPELTSLYGAPTWNSMTEAQQKKLCFREAINFFSVNLHGEAALLEGIARRVNCERFADISEYLRHFIDEENKHSMWFARFCSRYAGAVYPQRKLSFPTEVEQTEADFVFFSQITLFEELVDRFNVLMAADTRLCQVVRDINRLHHADETRHLHFGRKVMLDMWQRWSPAWSSETADRIRVSLDQYVETVWRELFNPAVYADAGISEPARVAMEGWVAREGFRTEMSEGCARVLAGLDENRMHA